MIQVFQPSLGSDEAAAVARVFQSNWIGKGPLVDQFEAAWAAHVGASPEQVVSVSCATEGLFQAVRLLGIGPGDEVIIPTVSFVGAGNAVWAAGARPVFCDVDSRTLNPTADNIFEVSTAKTAAVILLHYGGIPPIEREYCSLRCLTSDIALIEDMACSPLAHPIGAVNIWSFDAMKILSTGDGGMMYFADKELAQRARRSLYLGINESSGLLSNATRWWEFEVEDRTARRAIMNDLGGAIGLEQLKKLPDFIARRKAIYEAYNEQLAGLNWLLLPPPIPDHVKSSYYFYWVQCDKRDELARYLRAHDVYTTFRYWPLHWAYKTGDSLPGAERAARETLLLPLHQGLTDSEVNYVCEQVREFDE